MAFNSKKILKNTFVLYIRMVFTMLIALYTSRVVLNALGIDDYGLYTVVGGTVALFSFLKTSMASATQRFLSYELGRSKAVSESNRVFCASMTTHIVIALVLLVLCELIGVWFLNTQISIPEGRELAANVIFQFSVLVIFINLIIIPYLACVISHEDMTYYAYVSIFEAILKLLIAIAVSYVESVDRLMLYGFLILLIALVNLTVYWFICHKSYEECRFSFRWDPVMIKSVFSFSGWTLGGQFASVLSIQGVSILMNIFFSVAVNAAMGIALHVNSAVNGLVSNFQTAYQPQITKTYAAGEEKNMTQLMFQASKISFFLVFIVSLPILFNIDDILTLWLGIVPQHTNEFCVFILISSVVISISGPLWMAVFATGDIKNYQIALFVMYLTDFVLVYFLFVLGFPPVSAVIVRAIVYFGVIFVRLYYCRKLIPSFSAMRYFNKVLVPVFISASLSVVIAYLITPNTSNVYVKIFVAFIIIAVSVVNAYMIGLNKRERTALVGILTRFLRRG